RRVGVRVADRSGQATEYEVPGGTRGGGCLAERDHAYDGDGTTPAEDQRSSPAAEAKAREEREDEPVDEGAVCAVERVAAHLRPCDRGVAPGDVEAEQEERHATRPEPRANLGRGDRGAQQREA